MFLCYWKEKATVPLISRSEPLSNLTAGKSSLCGQSLGFFFSFDPTQKRFESTLCHTLKLLFQQTVWLPVCDSLSPSQGQQSREYHLLHHALSILMFSNKINIQAHAYYFSTELVKKHPLNPQRQHWLQREGNIFLSCIDLKGVDRAQQSFSVISKNKERAEQHKSQQFCQR